jgi:hypothetical protein
MSTLRTARAVYGIAAHLRRSGLRRPTLDHVRAVAATDNLVDAAKAVARGVVPGAGDKVTPAMRKAVYEADRYRCRACGSKHDLTIDHIVPQHLGGPTIMVNLSTLCKPCNSSKRDSLSWRGRKDQRPQNQQRSSG